MKKLLIITLFLAACGQDEPQPQRAKPIYYELGEVTHTIEQIYECRENSCNFSSKGDLEVFFYVGRSTIRYKAGEDVDEINIYRVDKLTGEKVLVINWIPENITYCSNTGCRTDYDELFTTDKY